MKRYAIAIALLPVAALAVAGLDAAPATKTPVEVVVANTPLAVSATYEPVQVCSAFYNPTTVYTVPSDRRLVVEDATVSATLDPGELVVGVVETMAGGAEVEHYVGTISGDVFRFARDGRMMRAYADAGTSVVVKAARRNAPENMEICFTGHLEPAPVVP